VVWVEIARRHWEGAAVETLEALERLRKVTDGQPQFGYHVFKLAALSSLGREAEQMAVVNEAAIQLAATRAEPFYLQWLAHGMALHRGRPEEARRWLDAAVKSWDALPPAARNQDNFQSRAAALLADAGRHEEAWTAAKKLEERAPGIPSVVGLMAMVLQAAGRNEEAAAYVKRLEQMDARFARGQPEFWRARLAARAGDKARAVELLQQAVARGLWFGNYNSLLTESGRNEPEFAILRGYPPYEELLRPKG
jgi:tetratricopeptide (TPR) repeat protein